MKVSDRTAHYIGRGLLWLLVLASLPIGFLMLAGTVLKAAVAAVVVAGLAGVIFLLVYLNRNSPSGRLTRAVSAGIEKPSDGGGHNG